jgi:hypothetical protein
MKIVLISGKAESGKDSFHELASKILKREGLHIPTRVAYADEVKFIAEQMGWNGEKDEKGRAGLIMVGDGAREYFDKLVWIRKLVRKIDNISNALDSSKRMIFVTDCRYPNEIDMVKNYFILRGHDVYSVRVIRPNHVSKLTPEQRANRSEVALDDYKDWDFVITNDATLRQFEQEVAKVISQIAK